MRELLPLLLLGICFLVAVPSSTLAQILQGSKPLYNTTPFTPGISHRQNICDRFFAYQQNDTLALRDALRGLELRPIITSWGDHDEIFRYTPETGIDIDYPGILVDILDALAIRAGFTWRDSFAIMNLPGPNNATVSQMIDWGVDTYDIAVDWFTRTPERMELGIAFMEPWRDGSIVLIAKPQKADDAVDTLFNFLRPFDSSVWLLTLLTVFLSALVYQFIEYLQGDREDRSLWQWTSDNLYLSAINFSQNFEYGPTSFGGRVFAVSMTLWALLMTATYTANLASLLVVSNRGQDTIETIEQVIDKNNYVCTWSNSAADEFIRLEYPNVKRIALPTELEGYQALQEGRCVLMVTNKDPWLLYKGDSRFNPTCDMEWVGRKLRTFSSGFAVKADVGDMCSAFIRMVLNVHMLELINEGYLDRYKARFRRRFQEDHPATCVGAEDEELEEQEELNGGTRKLLMASATSSAKHMRHHQSSRHRRQLKAGGKASAPPSAEAGDASSLNFEQMIGTFVLHWGLMGIAVIISAASTIYYQNQEKKQQLKEAGGQQLGAVPTESVTENGTEIVPNQCPRIDWEARYAQLSPREKAVVDVLFQLDHTNGAHSNTQDREMAPIGTGVGCRVERFYAAEFKEDGDISERYG